MFLSGPKLGNALSGETVILKIKTAYETEEYNVTESKLVLPTMGEADTKQDFQESILIQGHSQTEEMANCCPKEPS